MLGGSLPWGMGDSRIGGCPPPPGHMEWGSPVGYLEGGTPKMRQSKMGVPSGAFGMGVVSPPGYRGGPKSGGVPPGYLDRGGNSGVPPGESLGCAPKYGTPKLAPPGGSPVLNSPRLRPPLRNTPNPHILPPNPPPSGKGRHPKSWGALGTPQNTTSPHQLKDSPHLRPQGPPQLGATLGRGTPQSPPPK